MTQGQWLRLTSGDNPSTFLPGCIMHTGDAPVDLRHPVESVSWSECHDVLEQHGLRLPSCREWDYASGEQRDAAFEPAMFRRWRLAPRDTLTHAPAGSSRANAFYLHDMIDNVAEWCGDEVEFGSVLHRVVRGGDFTNPYVATWRRPSAAVSDRSETRGLRPARAIQR